MRDWLRVCTIAAAWTIAAPDLGLAKEGDPSACIGDVTGAALAPLPAGAAFRVDIYDDRVDNVRFRDAFLAALRKAGHRTADNGRLVVTFDAETYDAGTPRFSERSAGRLSPIGDPMSPTGNDLDRLANRPSPGDRGRSREEFHLNVQVRDQETSRVLWTGDLYCRQLDGTREQVVDSVIEAIIGVLGRTVTQRPL